MRIEHAGSGKAQRLDTLEEIKKPGAKNDAGKLRYDLLDDIAEEALVAVLTFGEYKYTANGWRKVPDAADRYYAALRRHAKDLRKYLRTREPAHRIDRETGFPTSAQLLCNALFICALDIAAHEGEDFDGATAVRGAITRWNEHLAKKAAQEELSASIERVTAAPGSFIEPGTRPSARKSRASKK